MKRKVIVVFILMLIILIIVFSTIYIKGKIYRYKYNQYILASKRDSYIINNIDKDLLKKYIGNENCIIVFWASWCSYCVKEAEDLNKFINLNPQIPIIIVSHDTDVLELEKYLKDNEYNWFVIFDKEKTIRENIDIGSSGIPSVYLLNKDLKILNFYKGPLNYEQFLKFYNQEKILEEE